MRAEVKSNFLDLAGRREVQPTDKILRLVLRSYERGQEQQPLSAAEQRAPVFEEGALREGCREQTLRQMFSMLRIGANCGHFPAFQDGGRAARLA